MPNKVGQGFNVKAWFQCCLQTHLRHQYLQQLVISATIYSLPIFSPETYVLRLIKELSLDAFLALRWLLLVNKKYNGWLITMAWFTGRCWEPSIAWVGYRGRSSSRDGVLINVPWSADPVAIYAGPCLSISGAIDSSSLYTGWQFLGWDARELWVAAFL